MYLYIYYNVFLRENRNKKEKNLEQRSLEKILFKKIVSDIYNI